MQTEAGRRGSICVYIHASHASRQTASSITSTLLANNYQWSAPALLATSDSLSHHTHQINIARSPGVSRCISCVHGQASDISTGQHSSSGRYNSSRSASYPNYALENPFAHGTFRWVAKGSYTSGPRQGQPCVAKWFKSGAVFSDTYFTLDIKAVDKSLEIVDKFNQSNIINKAIKVNIPQVWNFEDECYDRQSGQAFLCEPFIRNYQKFNSNTGWNDSSIAWGKAMQALSHFSYHITGGSYVLCDLQGGIYQREAVLSDPVILSRTRDYGVTDLGSDGICSFFCRHICNVYCRPEWTEPARPILRFNPVRGTTMIKHIEHIVHTRPSRPRMTRCFV